MYIYLKFDRSTQYLVVVLVPLEPGNPHVRLLFGWTVCQKDMSSLFHGRPAGGPRAGEGRLAVFVWNRCHSDFVEDYKIR